MAKKILVYGGSFDPPHIGHMWLLLQAMEFIQPDEVLIAPAWQSPLKKGHSAEYEDRREMLRLALSDFMTARRHDLIRIWDIERHHHFSYGRNKTYSYELIEDLTIPNVGNVVYFLAGSDVLERLHEWKQVKKFVYGCTLTIGIRPGTNVGVPADYPGQMIFLPQPTEGESSTEVRRRLSVGEPVDGILTPSVMGHIARKKLYAVRERV